MSTRGVLVVTGAIVACLWVASVARADTIKIGVYSQKESSSHATAGASITARGSRSARHPSAGAHEGSTQLIATPRAHGNDIVPYPSLPSTSPFLRDTHPLGPGSFWYSDGSGHTCIYMPSSVLPCYTVTAGGGGAPAGPGVNPAAIAAAIAARLELFPGRIQASPSVSRGGLTGADSWFWLAPAPRREVLSISLRGERVSVSADPSIEWRFGDGAVLVGGAGRPYTAGPPPADAIRHLYETRCLPGDVGPYVLPSCAARGYPLDALVHWAISFEATGPVSASGSLPSRTTSAGVAYPVSEARAFLLGGGDR
ncbi:MAG: hypothetical protein ACJ75G_00165 [Gaiellaceae bacterium]